MRGLLGSITGRVGILLVLAATGALALGAATVVFAVQSLRSAASVSGSLFPTVRDTQLLLTALVDQETGERGYLITGEKKFLQPFYQGKRSVDVLVAALGKELRGHTIETRQLASVMVQERTWLELTALPEIADVSAGRVADAIANEKAGNGKRRFDAVRASVATLSRSLALDEASSVTELRDRAQATLALAAVATVAALALLLVAWRLLKGWVTDPISVLESQVAGVAEGNLDQPVTASGLAEMNSLGRSVETMRLRLRAESEEVRHLREALAARFPLQQELRQELAAVGSASSISIEGRVLPAEGVLAGDWYDAWPVGDGDVAVAVVDASGHGPMTGVFALQVKTLLTSSSPDRDPGAAFNELATKLGDTGSRFVTGILVEVDPTNGVCRYANSGHPRGLVVAADWSVRRYLEPTGPLLGPFPASWRSEEFELEATDTLLLCTDGVFDARRRTDGSDFGEEGVLGAIARLPDDSSPREVLESIIDAIRTACVTPLTDDATIVVCRLRTDES
jgi:sigma-B regulation protein RsbU (phosphoserine phosphatase)